MRKNNTTGFMICFYFLCALRRSRRPLSIIITVADVFLRTVSNIYLCMKFIIPNLFECSLSRSNSTFKSMQSNPDTVSKRGSDWSPKINCVFIILFIRVIAYLELLMRIPHQSPILFRTMRRQLLSISRHALTWSAKAVIFNDSLWSLLIAAGLPDAPFLSCKHRLV